MACWWAYYETLYTQCFQDNVANPQLQSEPSSNRCPGPTVTFFIPSTLPSAMAQPTHNVQLELATTELAKHDKLNYMARVKRHGEARVTLRERFLGQTLWKQVAASKYRQRLTFVKEETLIKHINSLTDRGLPPTSRIVRNRAEEMTGGPVGKSWTGDFVKRCKTCISKKSSGTALLV